MVSHKGQQAGARDTTPPGPLEFRLDAQRWLERARHAYNLGVMVLFFGRARSRPRGTVGEMSS